MTVREAYTPKSKQQGAAGTKKDADIALVLERLIATLNRIEAKLDKN